MPDVTFGKEALYGEFDLTGALVTVGFEPGGDIHTVAPWGATMVQSAGGIPNGRVSLAGVLEGAVPLEAMHADAHTKVPWLAVLGTAPGQTPAEGDLCLFGNGPLMGPQVGLQNGDLSSWSTVIEQFPLIGRLLATGTKTGNGNGTGVQFSGGVADGQTVWAAIHCPTAASGLNDTVIESDDSNGFPSAITRIDFAQIATTPTFQFLTWKPAGGSTDDWFRANWTETGSHRIEVVMGIY